MHPASPTSRFLFMLVMALPVAAPRAQVAEPVKDSPTSPAASPVTIYRCTDAKGYLTLRDSPCNKGERQETRSMLRPKDAPLRPQSSPPQALASVTTPPPQIIIVNTPRTLYECVSPDNTRYLSDTPEGNARWVPLWPHAYPQPYPYPGQVTHYEPGRLNVRVDDGRVSGSYSSGGYSSGNYSSGGTRILTPTYSEFGGGTWVRDPCHALPQAEVCARLVDQRDVLRRRFTIAQASERAVLGREERSIGARLAQDCR
jgi:hypothetical protein